MIYIDFQWCGFRIEAEVSPAEPRTWAYPGFPPEVEWYTATPVDEDEARACWDLDPETVPDLERWAEDRDDFREASLEEASRVE